MLASKVTTKSLGDEAEERALQHLLGQGLTLVERNYRLARGPSARGAEVDLIMGDHGGAAASVSRGKQRKCILGAQSYLMTLREWPPCRFDVVAIDGEALQWLPAAFDAS
jgi:putative endonuclease